MSELAMEMLIVFVAATLFYVVNTPACYARWWHFALLVSGSVSFHLLMRHLGVAS